MICKRRRSAKSLFSVVNFAHANIFCHPNRLLFNESDEEDPDDAFNGDLEDLDMDDEFPLVLVYKPLACVAYSSLNSSDDDEPFQPGAVEEIDLDSDEEEAAPPVKLKSKRSKQAEAPTKIIPTLSDASSDDDDDEDVTMANMEKKSKALDLQAIADAEMDLAEIQAAAAEGELDDDELSDGVDPDDDAFHLPTQEEKEQEAKTGGPDVHSIQRRMREIVRVLAKFSKRAEKGRYV